MPPFLGSKVVKGIPLDDIAALHQRDRAVPQPVAVPARERRRTASRETDEQFKDRIRPTLRALLAECKAEDLLVPQVVYGYFAANGDGNDLVIWTDETRTAELARFQLPAPDQGAVPLHRRLLPAASRRATRSTTPRSTSSRWAPPCRERTAELFAANKYQDYLLLHGIGVEMAEALAELWHRRIREEWGFADEDGPSLAGLFRQQYRGGRYSWGYPACPDLEDNMTGGRAARRRPHRHRGVSEETGFQYQPEQTTSALICHHPRAKYFVAR